ncbi:MAG: hypothetical protein H7843_07535 [Nitrospirota bacterium]
MPTQRHQFILGLVIKKMRGDGFTINMIDGKYAGLFGEPLPQPSTILRHRPDAIGINIDGRVGIGEAKTEGDISNSRTYDQLYDFTSVELNAVKCEVYIGIPKSTEFDFKRKLTSLGLSIIDNLHVLYVPDEIING